MGPKKIVMNLNKKSNVFLIKLFDNKHNHVFTETASHSGRHTAAFIPLLRREFEKAPRDTPILEFISSMAKKYRTKPKRIQAALYFFRKTSFEFRQITNLAKLLNLRVWFKNNFHEEDYCDSNDTDQLLDEPELLMFSHYDSFSRVKHLEEVCYLMLLDYKLRGSGDKQWDVFILSALNLSYMLEPFAFVFIEVGHRNLVNVATILHKLFTLFGVMPRVMVTPSEDLYTELCLLLADKFGFRGLHLLDPIIEIDRIGATLDRYEDLSYFKAVLLSRSKAEYLSSLQRLSANCPASSAIRYNLNRVMKNAHRMIFGCLETAQYIGTIFDYSANKIIFDIIRENLMRFVCKYNDQDGKKAEPVKPLHGMTQSEKSSQKKCKVKREKGLTGGDYTKLNFSKLTYMRCVRLLMHVMSRSIPEVTNTSNYDLKPYETVVEIQDMVLIRRCIKSNLLYVFGDQYGKTFYLDYCEVRRGQNEDMRVLYVFDRRAKSWFVVAPFPIYCEDGSI